MARLKETMFEMMLDEELSAASERSQHLKAQHHTRFFALKSVLEECDLVAEYYEFRQDVLDTAARAVAGEGVA